MTFFTDNEKLEKKAQKMVKEVPQYFHSILYYCWFGDLCSVESSWNSVHRTKEYNKTAIKILEKRTKELVKNIKRQKLEWLRNLASELSKEVASLSAETFEDK